MAGEIIRPAGAKRPGRREKTALSRKTGLKRSSPPIRTRLRGLEKRPGSKNEKSRPGRESRQARARRVDTLINEKTLLTLGILTHFQAKVYPEDGFFFKGAALLKVE
ncbi:MAG: hypothetical protein LBR53_03390 [Deltaproteobacteria bacterium]|jgi:hypothetical protein|nr:hypothetical protein [Deltaproteobacteria bacterium]